MASIPFYGQNVTFFTQTTGSAYEQITNIESIDLPSSKRDRYDYTGLESVAKETVPGAVDFTDVKVNFRSYDITSAAVTRLYSLVETASTGSTKYAHIVVATSPSKTIAMTGSYYEVDRGKAEFGKPAKPVVVFKPDSITVV